MLLHSDRLVLQMLEVLVAISSFFNIEESLIILSLVFPMGEGLVYHFGLAIDLDVIAEGGGIFCHSGIFICFADCSFYVNFHTLWDFCLFRSLCIFLYYL